ncbi:SGNH/GDSL hydrolase family protein [Mariniflexile sp. AS56]|uniref:SGNH/GDSL hydrolase family protein n=1 Tax=Mariniflexile sp. AS56 TaxID=3063957 RepID=UPI0026ECF4A0|nr:SGNH/GDSL hydrolase family protein [Mariniflexile sp. AS56]MDO7171616.1 SGNH/GDSL hydrolase family protein [Mariniflexile sp. AS56]
MERKKFIKILGFGALGITVAPIAFAKSAYKNTNEALCKLTWKKLCSTIGKTYKTDAFKYVHPQTGKPNVFIYGDSISIAYSSAVRKLLAGNATVIRLFKNGGSSNDFISNMNKLQETMFQPGLEEGWDFKWDVIHFNVGLHDLKYLKGKHLDKDNGKQVSTISQYKENLEGICTYLKTQFPKAKLIFATTTPVPANAKGRFGGDSVIYNKAALEVLSKHPEIIINDLYTYTKPHLEMWAQEPGNVHYKELGFTAQGKEVARVISKNLSQI